MNYQEIPFFIWSENKKLAETISESLGREVNTHLEYQSIDGIYQFMEKTDGFTCYILQYSETMPSIESLTKALRKKCPCSPVILFSFQEITDSLYRRMIRSGASDILVYDEKNNAKKVRTDLLKTINNKWRMYLGFEREKKKIYQATIVTAYHEINQPLTVMLNAVGLIIMELKNLPQKSPKIEKFLKFIVKGIKKIQEILDRFKGIKNPAFAEYTDGVPMVMLSNSPKTEKNKQSVQKKVKENTVLIFSKIDNLQESIGLVIEKAGYQPLFMSDKKETVNIIASKANKIQAIIIDVNLSSEVMEELLFKTNLHMPNRSIIVLAQDENDDSTQRIMKKGTFSVLKRPFTTKQFKDIVGSAQKPILM